MTLEGTSTLRRSTDEPPEPTHEICRRLHELFWSDLFYTDGVRAHL